MRPALLFAFIGCVSAPAWALCIGPTSPARWCGAGPTSVRAEIVSFNDNTWVVDVLETRGEPLPAAQQSQARFQVFADDANPAGSLPTDGVAIFAVTATGAVTFVSGVDDDDRLVFDSVAGPSTMPADTMLDLLVSDDPAFCADAADEAEYPPTQPCNDSPDQVFGCTASPATPTLALPALGALLLLRRRRCHRRRRMPPRNERVSA